MRHPRHIREALTMPQPMQSAGWWLLFLWLAVDRR